MLNKVILMGRLTKDPELRMTQAGTAVTSFTLAVERNFTYDGEKQTDFISCVSFKNTAEFVKKYFVKGQLICICGMLQTRSWEDKENKKHYATEVIANEVQFTGDSRNRNSSESVPTPQGDEFVHVPDDNLPF